MRQHSLGVLMVTALLLAPAPSALGGGVAWEGGAGGGASYPVVDDVIQFPYPGAFPAAPIGEEMITQACSGEVSDYGAAASGDSGTYCNKFTGRDHAIDENGPGGQRVTHFQTYCWYSSVRFALVEGNYLGSPFHSLGGTDTQNTMTYPYKSGDSQRFIEVLPTLGARSIRFSDMQIQQTLMHGSDNPNWDTGDSVTLQLVGVTPGVADARPTFQDITGALFTLDYDVSDGAGHQPGEWVAGPADVTWDNLTTPITALLLRIDTVVDTGSTPLWLQSGVCVSVEVME